MTKKEFCFVCNQVIKPGEIVTDYSVENRTVIIHNECLDLLGLIIHDILQKEVIKKQISESSDISTLPPIQKGVDSEREAILRVLKWAAKHHPRSGLTPKELNQIFEDNFRWKLSNPSARLGELVERNQIRRKRDNKTYRYFSN